MLPPLCQASKIGPPQILRGRRPSESSELQPAMCQALGRLVVIDLLSQVAGYLDQGGGYSPL